MKYGNGFIMQHKVDLSTLLRIIVANNRSRSAVSSSTTAQSLTKALALEAIEALKTCDHIENVIAVEVEWVIIADVIFYRSRS